MTPRMAAEPFRVGSSVQVVLLCPRHDCQKIFVASYTESVAAPGNFQLQTVSAGTKRQEKFSDTIKGISEAFVKIYQQASSAEQDCFFEICGVGYRKAIEFLVKDYAIRKFPDKTTEIEQKPLGGCIQEFIDDTRIKNVATRATWLGNDETHYVRKWEGKNLQDLKALIRLTVHWLEMEAETERIVKEMPEGNP